MNDHESHIQPSLGFRQSSPKEKELPTSPEGQKQDDDSLISLPEIFLPEEIATEAQETKDDNNGQKSASKQIEKDILGKHTNVALPSRPSLKQDIQVTYRSEGEADFLLNENAFSNRHNELYSGLSKQEKSIIQESPLEHNSSYLKETPAKNLKNVKTVLGQHDLNQGQENGDMAHRESKARGNKSISINNRNGNNAGQARRNVEESKFQDSSFIPQQGSNMTEEINEPEINVPANILDIEVIVEGENNTENRQMTTEALQTEENRRLMRHHRPNNAQPSQQNQNEGANPPSLAITPITPAELHRIKEPETKMHLNHLIGFFCAVILCAIVVLLHVDQSDFLDIIFLIVIFYLGYFLLLEVFGTLKLLGDLWVRSEDFYLVLDAVSAALALIIIFLKLSNFLPVCVFACIPFAMVTVLYMLRSKANPNKKSGNMFLRLYYILQTLVITIRLDNYIDWDWSLILSLTGIVLGGLTAGSIAGFITLFSQVVRSRPIENRTYIYNVFMKIIGLVWYIVYYSLSLFGLISLFGAASALSKESNYDVLRLFAKVEICVGVFLVIFSISARKLIVDFMIMFGLVESHLARAERRKRRRQLPPLNFETEQKQSYFVMLSSTFFKPLYSKISTRGSESLQKLKTIIQRAKLGVERQRSENTMTSDQRIKTEQELRKQKEILDQKVPKMTRTFVKRTNKKEDAEEIVNRTYDMDRIQRDLITLNDKPVENINLALSVDDVKNIKDLHKEASPIRSNDDEGLCHLCYTNPPNAILMGCGHGGICYDCAVALVNRKDECLECREKITAIYKIDPNPRALNIVRGIELNKIIKHA